jgi:hypothetical protein
MTPVFENAYIIYFFTKQIAFMRRSTVLSFPLQLVFPGLSNPMIFSPSLCQWRLDSNPQPWDRAGNTRGGSITVPLTSCLTGLESAV